MSREREPLPSFLSEPTRIGDEISITGKWVPSTPGRMFRRSPDSAEMLQEWEDIHTSARSSSGVLSTEINHAVGEDAVLVHHVFADAEALTNYFETTGTQHMAALTAVATGNGFLADTYWPLTPSHPVLHHHTGVHDDL